MTLLVCAVPAAAQDRIERRMTAVEKRVTKVEKRVDELEGGAPSGRTAAQAAYKEPAEPIGVKFLRKKQVVGQEKAGLRLYLEFENHSRRRLYAFNGTLIFKDEKGAVIWRRPYGHSEPLGPGDKVEVSVGILTEKPKEYLKFVKAREITVTLKKQEVYGAD